MTQIPECTPVIVGAAQFTERLEDANYRALSPVAITAEAAALALADTGWRGMSAHIDTLMAVRTFEDSAPVLAFPFGRSNNFPRSVCARLAIEPENCVWGISGGDSPQRLLAEACEAIAAGRSQAALLCGGEAMSTGKHLVKTGASVDWAETVDGSVDDRGVSDEIITSNEINNGFIAPMFFYALMENARRAEQGASLEQWAKRMAELFAPLSAVAAANPLSAFSQPGFSAEEILQIEAGNRLVTYPYTQRLIARDQVNQSAAVVVVSTKLADQAGIPQNQRIYLHGYASAGERPVSLRSQLGQATSAGLALKTALRLADKTASDMDLIDIYSCFPIAVSNAIEAVGIASDDPRGLTVTGGLPFFGGPGNNYSMHALAELVHRLRDAPGNYGLLAANGGFMSKHAAGVYSTEPRAFVAGQDDLLTEQMERQPQVTVVERAQGEGIIESYTVVCGRDGSPAQALIAGRLPSGERFLARSDKGDAVTAQAMSDCDPLGRDVQVQPTERGNVFRLA